MAPLRDELLRGLHGGVVEVGPDNTAAGQADGRFASVLITANSVRRSPASVGPGRWPDDDR